MGGFAFYRGAAQLQGFGNGFLPAGHLDADVVKHIAPGGNLGHLVDLNALPEPQLPVGRFASGAGYFHFKERFKKRYGFLKMGGIHRRVMEFSFHAFSPFGIQYLGV